MLNVTVTIDVENTIETLIMAVLGFLGATAGGVGLVVVHRNAFLRDLVKHYILLDLINLTIINLCHLLWAVPSVIWHVNKAVPLLDYFFATLAFSAISLGFPPKLFLGMNRFFALLCNGRYFRYFEKTKYLQYGLMFAYPSLVIVLFSLPNCHPIFETNEDANIFTSEGACGFHVLRTTNQIVTYFHFPVSTFLDVSVFFLMRRRIRAFRREQTHQASTQKAENLKKEYRLAAQMLVNMGTGLVLGISVAGSMTLITGPPIFFIFFTGFWQLSSLISCLSYAILLRDPRPKQAASTSAVKANQKVVAVYGQ